MKPSEGTLQVSEIPKITKNSTMKFTNEDESYFKKKGNSSNIHQIDLTSESKTEFKVSDIKT